MNIKALLIAGLLTVSVSSAAAWAGHHGEGHKQRGMFAERMMRALDLSEQQQAQIKALREQHKSELNRGGRREMKASMDSLVRTSAEFDEQAVKELLASKQEERLQHQVARVKMQHQIWNILTEEQQEKFAQMKENHEQRRASKRGER
ncbi:Spy/CpxP family protein refolding chaperone [Pseudoalteromonas sp. SSDWG2]|uniref:Spy/CpxP family protein refolding chaperone n=1 Tax=Pseudoalteromonas sp. SSDWG2 TaxID=3139391 RepID=UPI003BAB94FE